MAERNALGKAIPIATATDHDRVQSDAKAEQATSSTAMNHAAMGHETMASMDHSKTKSGGMSHDMSDPMIAKTMEDEIRTRFFVALVLTIPVILYSSLGHTLFGLNLPTPIPNNWLLFILTTPIVFWAGWIFVGRAFTALRNRSLDMSVLITTGVLAAHLFSAYLTFTGGEDTFYDAAAMLVTFVLFGHWMEMRSRRGTTPPTSASPSARVRTWQSKPPTSC